MPTPTLRPANGEPTAMDRHGRAWLSDAASLAHTPKRDGMAPTFGVFVHRIFISASRILGKNSSESYAWRASTNRPPGGLLQERLPECVHAFGLKLQRARRLSRKIRTPVSTQELTNSATRGNRLASAVRVVSLTGVCLLTAVSAIITKEALKTSNLEPLAQVTIRQSTATDTSAIRVIAGSVGAPSDSAASIESWVSNQPADIHDPLIAPKASEEVVVEEVAAPSNLVDDTTIRFFNGRPVRPARTIRMSVTAYSPDENSCAGSVDNITSSNHDVHTNAMKLVAADSRILPLGSLVSVPGYDDGRVVPVLDRGGAIKGNKLDVLYPTDAIAKRWGRQSLTVTVWEYADGLPASDYRKIRDSKN